MISAIFLSLLAGFFTWIFLDLIVEAIFSRLMDPSITQRSETPLATKIVHGAAIGIGVTVTAVVFAFHMLSDG